MLTGLALANCRPWERTVNAFQLLFAKGLKTAPTVNMVNKYFKRRCFSDFTHVGSFLPQQLLTLRGI